MKKGEIKRRKRVMPAMSNQNQQPGGNATSGFDSSVSPDPQQSNYSEQSSAPYQQNREMNLPHHERPRNGQDHTEHLLEPPTQSYGPPPVDFTSYSSPSTATAHRDREVPKNTYPPMMTDQRISRKRTLSAAKHPAQPLRTPVEEARSTIQAAASASRPAAAAGTGEPAIDPTLGSYAAGGSPQTNGETKAERKARLEQQREAIRLQMEALNRDIAMIEESEE
jgi:GATA-binding protein